MLSKLPFFFINYKKYVLIFKKAGANDKSSAVSLDQIGLHNSVTLSRFINLGIIVNINEKYYLDNEKLKNYNKRVHKSLFFFGP
jgi:hypothetical protein